MTPPPLGGEDLDGLIRRVDHDRWLSSRFIADAEARADVVALYAFDHELRRAREVASKPVLAEIRLTWWSEVLGQIAGAGPVRRHPVAHALERAVRRRGVAPALLEGAIDARLYALDGDREAGEAEAAEHLTAAAALALDPRTDVEAAKRLGRAWATRVLTPEARAAARRISAAGFPAVAHAALTGGSGSELARRLRLTWAVARGRV